MSQVFAVDANNDVYLATDGTLARSQGLDAVLQACAQAAKTQLAEMIYATDEGVPNFDTVWNGSPNLAQFQAYLRRAFLAVDNVTDVPELSVSATNNKLSYRAVIRTVYGTGAIDG